MKDFDTNQVKPALACAWMNHSVSKEVCAQSVAMAQERSSSARELEELITQMESLIEGKDAAEQQVHKPACIPVATCLTCCTLCMLGAQTILNFVQH